MSYSGVTIFLVFFGVSFLDALFSGNWVRAVFWIGMGAFFFVLDKSRRRETH